MKQGTLYGLSLGPGDPGLITCRAWEILQGEAIFEAVDRAPGRWAAVEMTDRTSVEGEDCIVLAYRARARREDGSTHEALCSSTWVRQGQGWRIIQHQQTAPAD